MATHNETSGKLIERKILITSMLAGGLLGMVLIAALVFSFDGAKPEWGRLWRLRPLIITPIATACGAAFFYLVYRYFVQQHWSRVVAIIIGVIGFIISLWMGTILGLDGTLWN